MNLDLTDHEAAALLKELNGLIDGDRYFLSDRIMTLKAIRAKMRPEPAREPLPQPPPKRYAPPRATTASRRAHQAPSLTTNRTFGALRPAWTYKQARGSSLVPESPALPTGVLPSQAGN